VSQFPLEIIAAAQASAKKYYPYGPFPSVTLAQWALESAYGTAEPTGSNNPFGIKAIAGQASVVAMTHETLHGVYVALPQSFAKFATVAEAFDAHAKLLATAACYHAAQHAQTPDEYAQALQGVYATGIPNHPYGGALIAIMRAANLYQYDDGGVRVAGSTAVASVAHMQVRKGFLTPLLTKGSVAWAQVALTEAGFAPGEIDDMFGKLFKTALLAFQNSRKLPPTGVLDAASIVALEPFALPATPVAPVAATNVVISLPLPSTKVSNMTDAAVTTTDAQNAQVQPPAAQSAPRVTPTVSQSIRVDWGSWVSQLVEHEKPIIEAAASGGLALALHALPFGTLVSAFIGPAIVKQYVDQALATLEPLIASKSLTVSASNAIMAAAAKAINDNEPSLAGLLSGELDSLLLAAVSKLGLA
jgi:hypothetical protein